MNFTEVVAAVQSIVKRPDKLSDMQRAVNASVSFYSQDSDFKRDIEEVALPIDSQEYTGNISYAQLLRFRKFHYIKRGNTNCYLCKLDTSRIATEGNQSCDQYYEAGGGVRYSLKALASSLDIGYFQYPPRLTDDIGAYWMLDLNPDLIIDRAAGVVFAAIGDDSSAKYHRDQANGNYLSWRGEHLVGH